MTQREDPLDILGTFPDDLESVATGLMKAADARAKLDEVRELLRDDEKAGVRHSEKTWEKYREYRSSLNQIAEAKKAAFDERMRQRGLDADEAIALVRRLASEVHAPGLYESMVMAVPKAILHAVSGSSDAFRDELQTRTARWNELRAFMFQKPSPVTRDWDEAFSLATNAKESLDADWARWKQAKEEEYVEKLREIKRTRWHRMEELSATMRKCDDEVIKCEVMRDGAKSSEFADRVDGWISEWRTRHRPAFDEYYQKKHEYDEVSAKIRELGY